MNIKRMREIRKLRQKEVAAAIGVTPASYCDIENRKNLPSVETAKRIGIFFGFDWWKLFEDDDDDMTVDELTDNERRFLEAYRGANDVGQAMIRRELMIKANTKA